MEIFDLYKKDNGKKIQEHAIVTSQRADEEQKNQNASG